VEALLFEVKTLFYSYKVPVAYQVKSSTLLIPPSALLGAIYRGYVREAGLSYTGETLSSFLVAVKYAGVAVLPEEGLGEVLVRKFEVTRRLWRYERDVKPVKLDAMVREYAGLRGRVVGVVAFEGLGGGFRHLLARALEGIEYLGDSESIAGVRVLDESPQVFRLKEVPGCSDGFMAQLIAGNADRLPKLGVIEQCGRVPKTPWGPRHHEDVCYVWQPLAPRVRDRYRPLRYADVEREVGEDVVANMWCVESGRAGARLIFSTAGFECLSAPVGARGRRG